MKSFFLYNFLIFLTCVFTQQAFGQDFAATIVTKKGDVKVLQPAKPTSHGPFVLYEGQRYTYKMAGIGRKVKGGEVIQCGPNGKTKLIYKNGDHMIVGEGTSLVMPTIATTRKHKNKRSEMTLLYGKVRAMISKKGPRNNLDIKTKSAVAGVRGTDFFISSGLSGTNLTVLRGQVDIKKNTDSTSSPPLKVKTGYSAKVKSEASEPTLPKTTMANEPAKNIELEVTTKEKLLEVQTESAVTNTQNSEDTKNNLKKEMRLELDQLNQKSVEVVLEDIKTEDLELFEKIKDKKQLNTSEIQTQVVAKLYKKAPSKKVKNKMTSDDIDSIGQDVYQKYFNENDE